MRETGHSGWGVHNSSDAWRRGLRLAVAVAGIGLVMTAGAARAQEADDDNTSFEDKIIRNIMTGLGGTNMENRGIDYRERSPLVVPPKLDLPPPETASSEIKVPNWPKDPDIQRAKAQAAEEKKIQPQNSAIESARPLTPAEMAPKRAKTTVADDTNRPGDPNKNIILSPAQLGVTSGMFKNVFGSNKGETAAFKGEPTRENLTQPPVGYQTPSANFAYGTGPKEVMKNSADINPMTGKY